MKAASRGEASKTGLTLVRATIQRPQTEFSIQASGFLAPDI